MEVHMNDAPARQKSSTTNKSSHDRLRLSAMRVAMVAPFIAKDDPRFYLKGINVRPHPDGGAIITATNGHILGAVHDKLATCDHEVTLQIHPSIVAACRLHKGDQRELVMLKGRLAVVHGHEEICIQPGDPLIDDATFPQYERVIPRAEELVPGLVGHFQVKYMAMLQDAVKVARKPGKSPCTINFFHKPNQGGSVGIARTPVLDEFVAVLMPCRDENPDSSVPKWHANALKALEQAPADKQAA
jgi:hypothetical protein